jgi:predicted  nucleic acid-binding Zn ribbon protein
MADTHNWLHAEHLRCPACYADLWRVDHSPFYDEAFFYCDTCPRHAEVSYYDPQYRDAAADEIIRIHEVEAHLKPCVCGGHFRFAAARRCPTCWTPVIVEDPAGIDLFYWEPFLDEDAPELEPAAQKIQHLARTDDLWRDE